MSEDDGLSVEQNENEDSRIISGNYNPLEEEKDKNFLPESNVELNMMLANTNWGKGDMNQKLIKQLKKKTVIDDLDDMWSVLAYYQRDIRLANLNDDEMEYVRFYLEIAGDLLYYKFKKPFLLCLNRGIDVLETSQSRKGFLRNRIGTDTRHIKHEYTESIPRRGLFNLGKKQQEGMR